MLLFVIQVLWLDVYGEQATLCIYYQIWYNKKRDISGMNAVP
jgi:hypothetical protein